MTAPRREAAPGPKWWRPVATGCIVLAVLLLPVLVAGTRIDAPPTPAELEHLRSALAPTGSTAAVGSEVARQFYVSMLFGTASVPADPEAAAAVVAQARTAQLVSLLGITLLLYLGVLLARGRLQALLAVGALLMLPPIGAEGHVLRPETPTAVFCLLSLVLLQCLAQSARQRHGGRAPRLPFVAGLVLCATVAQGLAVATLPSSGECLLVPGVVLTIAAVQLGLRGVRVVRRQGLERLPIRSINGRLLPWTATALLAPAVALLLLSVAVVVPVEALPSSMSTAGLWPAAWPFRLPLFGLLGLGVVAGVLRVGLRFGRRGRIGADLVLLVFCVVFLATAIGTPDSDDRLVAAPAMAAVLSEGLRTLLVLLRAGAGALGWSSSR
ncbi:MAG TPA: hypothetical protein VFZ65_18725 [Planctomycetota bacterium]|nr:hypothetical protein [Planctomycetota bacterium]